MVHARDGVALEDRARAGGGIGIRPLRGRPPSVTLRMPPIGGAGLPLAVRAGPRSPRTGGKVMSGNKCRIVGVGSPEIGRYGPQNSLVAPGVVVSSERNSAALAVDGCSVSSRLNPGCPRLISCWQGLIAGGLPHMVSAGGAAWLGSRRDRRGMPIVKWAIGLPGADATSSMLSLR